jgi:hypothetical protein
LRVIPWDTFAQSVTEAQQLSQAEDFDFLHRIVDGYSQIRRYGPAFLEATSRVAGRLRPDDEGSAGQMTALHCERLDRSPRLLRR